MKKFTCTWLALLVTAPVGAFAADEQNIKDLTNLSLESLGNIVTSVSRKPEDSFRSAAAIYVITNDDIKASGATHIAEVLRGVPGLNFARIDASNWAVSSRGFTGLFANKLLVLVDGRTIYTPLFSGVYWDIQNMPLEDIDRVEVIRGPGATQWGANAVNGVINIITKSAADTQGTYASTLAGNLDRSITDVRYGGKMDGNVFYRAYGHYEKREETQTKSGADGNNNWYTGKMGFRSDWNATNNRKITIQGDAYNSDIDLDLEVPSFTESSGINAFHDKIRSKGFNILSRLEEKHSPTLSSTFQAYIDYQSPDYSSLHQDIYTYDFDYQTSWKMNASHDIMWGSGVRYIQDDLTGSSTIMIGNPTKHEYILNAFLQDQIALTPKELFLTLGSKLEHNSFSGLEIEPSARLAWYPDNTQTVWTSVSRAVRTPNLLEQTTKLNLQTAIAGPGGLIAQQIYNTGIHSEDMIAYELGYRVKPAEKISLDSSIFFNDYSNLVTFEQQSAVDAGNGIDSFLPYQVNNLGTAKTYGFEESATWDVTARWNLLANYTYLNMALDKQTSQDTTFENQNGDVAHHQLMLRSQVFLPNDVRIVNTGYYVSHLSNQNIDDYIRLDAQVLWQPVTGVELSLVGQNLLHNEHSEFGAPLWGKANEIPRTFYGRVSFKY